MIGIFYNTHSAFSYIYTCPCAAPYMYIHVTLTDKFSICVMNLHVLNFTLPIMQWLCCVGLEDTGDKADSTCIYIGTCTRGSTSPLHATLLVKH